MRNQLLFIMFGKFHAIGTKVKPSDKIKLDVIANKFGMTLYELFQALLLMLVRYLDCMSSASVEHEQIIKAFFNTVTTIQKGFNPMAMINKSQKVKSAILFLEQRKKDGLQPIFVCVNKNGELEESYNIDFMLNSLLASIDPQLLEVLQSEKEVQGYFSLTNALQEIVVNKSDKIMHEEINKLFSDEVEEIFSDLSIETCEEAKDDVYYKRKHYKGIDAVGNYTGAANRPKWDKRSND